jgi:cell division protein FtsL
MKTDMVGIRKQVMGKVDGLSPVYRGLLLVAVVLCALSVVTSQHKARKLFIELQKEKEQAQQMEVEWGQLQLEQSTWAAPARVEEVAVQKLQMQLPKNGQVQFIRMKQPSPQSSDGTTDRTTSHLTNPAKDAGQVIGYSHSTRLEKNAIQVAGYPASGESEARGLGEKSYNGTKPQR